MRLTSEREQEIRDMIPYLSPYSVISELFAEIDHLRQENAKQWLNLTSYSEQIGFMEGCIEEQTDILAGLLETSREKADDHELGEENYYYWVELAKELLE